MFNGAIQIWWLTNDSQDTDGTRAVAGEVGAQDESAWFIPAEDFGAQSFELGSSKYRGPVSASLQQDAVVEINGSEITISLRVGFRFRTRRPDNSLSTELSPPLALDIKLSSKKDVPVEKPGEKGEKQQLVLCVRDYDTKTGTFVAAGVSPLEGELAGGTQAAILIKGSFTPPI